jgi:hypothetical protein
MLLIFVRGPLLLALLLGKALLFCAVAGQASADVPLQQDSHIPACERSVMTATVRGGIEAKRLRAAGFGQERPVADNRSGDGRAKNRRVELVKQ